MLPPSLSLPFLISMGNQILWNLDIDECQTKHQCHSCRNLPGSFECDCRGGNYYSFAANMSLVCNSEINYTCFDL